MLVFPICPENSGKKAWDKTKIVLQETIPLCMEAGHSTRMEKFLQWKENPCSGVSQYRFDFFLFFLIPHLLLPSTGSDWKASSLALE